MAQNRDHKDTRISELEAALKAANEATVKAQESVVDAGALKAHVEKLEKELAAERSKSAALEASVKELRDGASKERRATFSGLPKAASQLRESVVVVHALSGARAYPVAGDVVCAKEALDEAQRVVGVAAKVIPVGDEELASLRKTGRTY